MESLSRAITIDRYRTTKTRLAGLPYARSDVRATRSLRLGATTGRVISEKKDSAAVAAAMILEGRTGEAAALLESLLAATPEDARLWSDLAAARYEDALEADDPVMYAKSLAAADRALDLRPDLAEASTATARSVREPLSCWKRSASLLRSAARCILSPHITEPTPWWICIVAMKRRRFVTSCGLRHRGISRCTRNCTGVVRPIAMRESIE